MFGFGLPQLLIILVIILLVCGAGKLPELGRSVGLCIRNFKDGKDGKDGNGDDSKG